MLVIRLAHEVLARSLPEFQELRRVCYFATNFHEFFLLCVFDVGRSLRRGGAHGVLARSLAEFQ
jgi:hypothetical protein